MYKILFDTCGDFKKGDLSDGSTLGNLEYLLRVGAIEEVVEKKAKADQKDAE